MKLFYIMIFYFIYIFFCLIPTKKYKKTTTQKACFVTMKEQKEENVWLLLQISNNATDTLFPSLKKLT